MTNLDDVPIDVMIAAGVSGSICDFVIASMVVARDPQPLNFQWKRIARMYVSTDWGW